MEIAPLQKKNSVHDVCCPCTPNSRPGHMTETCKRTFTKSDMEVGRVYTKKFGAILILPRIGPV